MLPLLATLVLAAPQGAPEPAGWDGFPVLVWRQRYSGREVPADVLVGFGGVNVERDDPAEWALKEGLDFYVGHAPGRNALHIDAASPSWQERWRKWVETRDESLLVREPCLTDPMTIALLEANLERTLEARGGNHGLGISLGDEVSLTPSGNPSDVCRSPTCEAAWGAWAKEHGWPEHAPTTDEVRLALSEDDLSLVGPWLARRRFHQEMLLAVLQRLETRARNAQPGVFVGLLGIGGQTAFGDVSIQVATGILDFVECYDVGVSARFLHTLRSYQAPFPGSRLTRSLATVFLNEDGKTAPDHQAWRHWLNGADGLVVWSDEELEGRSGKYGAQVQALRDAVEELRTLRVSVGPCPAPRGVAIVQDADSTALAWLRDAVLDGATWPNRFASYQRKHGTRERSLLTWMRLLEDAGFSPGLVTWQGVLAQRTRERFGVLVLCHQLIFGEHDFNPARSGSTPLELFLEDGGIVVIDGPLGWVDRRGRPLQGEEAERFEFLRAKFPGQVHRAPAGLTDYLERRAEPEVHARAWDRLAPLIEGAGVERRPWSIEGEGAMLPWVCSWEATSEAEEGEGRLCVMVPNVPLLEPVEVASDWVRVVPLAGYRVEWLSPRPGAADGEAGKVPQSQARVFRLCAGE